MVSEKQKIMKHRKQQKIIKGAIILIKFFSGGFLFALAGALWTTAKHINQLATNIIMLSIGCLFMGLILILSGQIELFYHNKQK